MTNTEQTAIFTQRGRSRLEDRMTSYELLAAERSTAIRSQAAERARRAAHLADARRHSASNRDPRRLRARLRLGLSRPA